MNGLNLWFLCIFGASEHWLKQPSLLKHMGWLVRGISFGWWVNNQAWLKSGGNYGSIDLIYSVYIYIYTLPERNVAPENAWF